MADDRIIDLQNGFSTAFINQTFQSNLAYRPQFIYNDNKNGQKVFSSIEEELLRCDSFAISVAFITRGGITPLLQTLKELERKHIPGADFNHGLFMLQRSGSIGYVSEPF